MQGIELFRQRFPQYAQLDDEKIARAVYDRDYAGKIDYNAFRSKFFGRTPVSSSTAQAADAAVPSSATHAAELGTTDGLGSATNEELDAEQQAWQKMGMPERGPRYDRNATGEQLGQISNRAVAMTARSIPQLGEMALRKGRLAIGDLVGLTEEETKGVGPAAQLEEGLGRLTRGPKRFEDAATEALRPDVRRGVEAQLIEQAENGGYQLGEGATDPWWWTSTLTNTAAMMIPGVAGAGAAARVSYVSRLKYETQFAETLAKTSSKEAAHTAATAAAAEVTSKAAATAAYQARYAQVLTELSSKKVAQSLAVKEAEVQAMAAAKRAAIIAGGAAEGGIAAGINSEQIMEILNQVDEETMMKYEPYREMRQRGFNHEAARSRVALDQGLMVGLTTAIVTGALGAPLNSLIGKWAAGGSIAASHASAAAKLATFEGGQEFFQEGAEQLIQNIGEMPVTGKSPWDHVLENAVTGLTVGFLIGGAGGVVAGHKGPAVAKPEGPSPEMTQKAAHLSVAAENLNAVLKAAASPSTKISTKEVQAAREEYQKALIDAAQTALRSGQLDDKQQKAVAGALQQAQAAGLREEAPSVPGEVRTAPETPAAPAAGQKATSKGADAAPTLSEAETARHDALNRVATADTIEGGAMEELVAAGLARVTPQGKPILLPPGRRQLKELEARATAAEEAAVAEKQQQPRKSAEKSVVKKPQMAEKAPGVMPGKTPPVASKPATPSVGSQKTADILAAKRAEKVAAKAKKAAEPNLAALKRPKLVLPAQRRKAAAFKKAELAAERVAKREAKQKAVVAKAGTLELGTEKPATPATTNVGEKLAAAAIERTRGKYKGALKTLATEEPVDVAGAASVRRSGQYYGKLPKEVADKAVAAASKIVGKVKLGRETTPGGSDAHAIKFAYIPSGDPRLKALRDAGFQPDVVHSYGTYGATTAFIGDITAEETPTEGPAKGADLTKTEEPDVAGAVAKKKPGFRVTEVVTRKGQQVGEEALLAPNGKPSKLTRAQWEQVRTPEFKNWFGDWERYALQGVWNDDKKAVSKVVDKETGEPLVVYHGSPKAGYDAFQPGAREGTSIGQRVAAVFFTDSHAIATTYSGRRANEVDLLRPEGELPAGWQTKQSSAGGVWTVVNENGRTVATSMASEQGAINAALTDYYESIDVIETNEGAGYYPVFLNIRDPNESDFEGANWDGSRQGQWAVYKTDESGFYDPDEQIYADDGTGYFGDRDEAMMLALLKGGTADHARDHYQSTNGAVSEAKQYNNDGAIMRNVVDNGGRGEVWEPSDVFAIFSPTQAKSATQNRGTFDPEDPRLAFSVAPMFYSAALRAVEAIKMTKGTGAQWFNALRNTPGVKPDELVWTGGADEWLKAQEGPVTKEALLDYMRANEVKVEEVVHDEDSGKVVSLVDMEVEAQKRYGKPYDDLSPGETATLHQETQMWPGAKRPGSGKPTKFERYTLPGGKNQRELLLTLPMKQAPKDAFGVMQSSPTVWKVTRNGEPMNIRQFPTREAAENRAQNYNEGDQRAQTEKNAFKSGHFDTLNVLAHIRFNERWVPDPNGPTIKLDGQDWAFSKDLSAKGERGYLVGFVEEFQSDWHQKGRKQGYAKRAKVRKNEDGSWSAIAPDGEEAAFDTEAMARDSANFLSRGVPDAPFKTTWPELALKRMIRWAAENGYDQIAWTTGDIQTARYDLSKHLDSVIVEKYSDKRDTYNVTGYKNSEDVVAARDIPKEDIPNYIGKDATEKAFAEMEQDGTEKAILLGLDLQVGGEGMKGFYDNILPGIANKLGKKFGTKVGQIAIETGVERIGGGTVGRPVGSAMSTVHSLPITPAMRESVMQGQPMFAQNQGRPTQTISPVELDRVVNQIEAAVGYRLNVAPRQNQLPAYMKNFTKGRQLAGAFAAPGGIPEAWLVAEHIETREEAIATGFHELTHMGLQGVLGPARYGRAMDQIRKSFPERTAWAATRNELNTNHPNPVKRLQLRRRAAEELVAYAGGELLAGRGTKNQRALWQRIIDVVRRVLHEIGLLSTWSKGDIEALIYRSMDYVRATSKSAAAQIRYEGEVERAAGAANPQPVEPPRATLRDFTPETVGGILEKGDWAILSADNPGNKTASADQNMRRWHRLRTELGIRGHKIYTAEGRYSETGGPPENSFVVTGISETAAVQLGRQFGQESVLTRHGLVYMDGRPITPATGVTVHKTAPANYYTKIPATGALFTVDLNWDVAGAVRDDVTSAIWQLAEDLDPAQHAKLNRATARKLVDIFNSGAIPDIEEMGAVAEAGQTKRGWYRDAAEMIANVFGPDGPRFAALLASLSPQVKVSDNLRHAIKVWVAWDKAGRPTDRKAITKIMASNLWDAVDKNGKRVGVLYAWIPNSVRALKAEDASTLVLSGPKVASFHANLRGDTNKVTLDSWMAMFAFLKEHGLTLGGSLNKAQTDPGKRPAYMAYEVRVRQTAKYLTKKTGEVWTPAEVQETIWSWTYTLAKLAKKYGSLSSAREIIQNGELTDDLINATPDFATLFAQPEHQQILRDAGYGDALDRANEQQKGRSQARRKAPTPSADSRERLLTAAGRLDRFIAGRRRSKTVEDIDVAGALLGGKTGNPDLDAFLSKVGRPRRTLKQFWADSTDRLWARGQQGLFDDLHGILRAGDLAGLSAADVGFKNAHLARSAAELTVAIIEHGYPVWHRDGTHEVAGIDSSMGGGALAILKPLGNKLNLWAAWKIANRADRLMGEGRENLFEQREIDAAKDLHLQHPEFLVVDKQYVAFQKKVLDFAQEAGVIDPQTRALWEHADYIPFYRLIENSQIQGPNGGGPMGKVRNQIRRLRGGKTNLGDPLENIARNWHSLMDASLKAHAARTVVDALDGSGLVTRAPQFEFTQALVPLSQVKDFIKSNPLLAAHLKAAGLDPAKLPPAAFAGLQKMLAVQAPSGEDIVTVWRGGKREYWHVHDDLLFESMMNIGKAAWGPWMEPFRLAKSVGTFTITSTAAFGVKNFWRDSLHVFIQGATGRNITITPGLDSVKGLISQIKMDADAQQMLAGGGTFTHGYIRAGDTSGAARSIRRSLRKISPSEVVLDSIPKVWRFYRDLLNAAENSNRVAMYRRMRKAGASRLESVYEARDTLDFAKHGNNVIVQFLTQTVMFMNARAQGLHRLARGAGGKKAVFASIALRGVMYMMAILALSVRYRDDERYKALTPQQKATYIHFFDVFSDGDHWQLPVPFEVGTIFGTVPVAIFDALVTNADEPDRWKQAMSLITHAFAQSLNMSPEVQLTQPLLELAINRDTFTQQPVLSMGDEAVLPEDQDSPSVGSTYRLASRLAPSWAPEALRSPKQLQHLGRGYLGNLQDYVLAASDIGARKVMGEPPPPARAARDITDIRSFIQTGPARQTKYGNVMYDIAEEAQRVHASISRLEKAGTEQADQRIEELETENEQLLDVRKDFVDAVKETNDLRKEMRAIQLDPDLTPQEKREQIDELQIEMNEIARDVYDLRPDGKLNPETASNLIGKNTQQQQNVLRRAGFPATAAALG